MNVQYTDLKEKMILVTGATRGIGKELALELARQGAKVVFNFREGKEDVAQKLENELAEAGSPFSKGLCFDITHSESMKLAIEAFISQHGAIEGLINNAGISRDSLMLRLKEEELSQVIDTNLKGAILLTQFLCRNFLKGQNVSVVNMSSIVGLMGNAGQVAYSASKAGLIGFTKSLAKELGAKNIRVNAVCPGFIETEMTGELKENVKEQYLSGIPQKRFGQPQEVAQLACFLLSSASSYITGEVIKIDGGLYI